jgi:hypothetical protein
VLGEFQSAGKGDPPAWSTLTVRFFLPALLVGVAFRIFRNTLLGWGGLLVFPIVLAVLFLLLLAVVHVRDGKLQYKRFLKWTTIDRNEIVSVGRAGPFIGYMRLNRFTFPWGRLYFVLDRNQNPSPFQPGHYLLLRYLLNQPAVHEEVSASPADERKIKIRLLGAAAVGMLLPLLYSFLEPKPVPQSALEQPFNSGKPAWIAIPLRVYQLIDTFPGILIVFVIFVLFTIYRWRRPNAWILALGVGASFAYMLLNWLK